MTFKEKLKEIRDPKDRRLAQKYLRIQGEPDAQAPDNLIVALSVAFVWKHTVEGFQYWSHVVADIISDMIYPLDELGI